MGLEESLGKIKRYSPQGVLFDFDYVLIDVGKSQRLTIKEVVEYFLKLDEKKEEISYEEIQQAQHLFPNDWECTQKLLEKRGISLPLEEVVNVYQPLYRGGNGKDGYIKNEEWILDNNILLKMVEKGIKIAGITGRPREEAYIAVDNGNARDFFEVLYCMGEINYYGGKAKTIAIAMDYLGIERAVYLGDLEKDMAAAKEAQIPGIGIIPPNCQDKKHEDKLYGAGADVVLKHVNEIQKLFT